MTRGRWIFLIALGLLILSYARGVEARMKAAQAHAANVANADSMVGIVKTVVSYIFG